ncbi:MAG: TetR/AcrR family transcriptional regulator [Oscillospiraceae bacterium]|nr:TetR/AcrR family transcriptional regulator [Oscillospiraceae bacterium]
MEDATDLRVVKTRRTIRNALVDLMSEKELAAITISELSARAEVNRKTFYRHYRTIADVVSELENGILSEFSEILRSDNDSLLNIGAVFRDISALVERRRDFFVRLMTYNHDLFNNGKIKAMLRKTLSVSLRKAGAAMDEKSMSAVSEFLISGVLALYADWFDNGCEGSLELITDISVRMAIGGLGSYLSAAELSAVKLK